MMDRPRLNRALVLETAERVPDGAGGFTENWLALGTLWADINARSGREAREAVAPISSVTLRIVVRAAPVGSSKRPMAGQRFREGARVYVIEAVSERDADGHYLTCFAKEEVSR